MTSIFSKLAVVALACMLATTYLGWRCHGRLDEVARLKAIARGPSRSEADRALQQIDELDIDAARQNSQLHRLVAIATCLVVMLVNAITATYFIGTSRWCREVVATYALDQSWAAESATLKRRAFPWVLLGMMTILVVAALGAMADPATGVSGTHEQLPWHLAAAMGGIALMGWALYVQWNYIGANHEVINKIMDAVQRVRRERGLEVS